MEEGLSSSIFTKKVVILIYMNMNLERDIARCVVVYKNHLEDIAEPSWKEEKTKAYIVRQLGMRPFWTKRTAVIYKIGDGPAVFWRAELDALPTRKGIKHVCGHAAHTAALMGAYMYFKKKPPQDVKIYFVFQPSEESYPSGAAFIADKFKPLRKCRAGFAFHVEPELSPGVIANPTFASGDYFEIEVHGRAAHIKDKYLSGMGDAILAGGALAKTINTKRAKNWIVNVGVMQGGDAPNKIAGKALLCGDVRALTEKARSNAHKWLQRVCKQINDGDATKIKLRYHRGYPILKNDPVLLKKTKSVLDITAEKISFGTEDFSLYPAPKALLLYGVGGTRGLHEDSFQVSNAATKGIFHQWLKLGNDIRIFC